jgi:hypothetical protein
MTQLPRRPAKATASGLSPETDAFLGKLMKQNGMSYRKQRDLLEQIQTEGALPRPPKPKPYQAATKPRPEQKVFTMARVGQRPLVKQEETILDETNGYEREQAPSLPAGPSSEQRKQELVSKMWGIDEDAMRLQQEQEREAALAEQREFTMDDQIIAEIQDRTQWLEGMHDLGVHKHDGETLRQIDQRMEELKKRRKKKEEQPQDDDSD